MAGKEEEDLGTSPRGAGAGFAPNSQAADEVKKRDVDWERYRTTGFINDAELQLLQDYDKKSIDLQNELIDRRGPQYAELFLSLLNNAPTAHDELPQYILTLVDNLLARRPDGVTLFRQLARDNPRYPYGPFIKLIKRNDPYIVQKSCKILTGLSMSGRQIPTEDLAQFLEWTCAQLSTTPRRDANVQAAVSALQLLLRVDDIRQMFWRQAGAFDALVGLLEAFSRQYQTVYQITFCIWLLSYNKTIVQTMNDQVPVIAAVLKVVRNVPKEQEKIIRVSIAFFLNIISQKRYGAFLVTCGVSKTIAILLARKWDDADIPVMIEELNKELQEYEQDLSSFGQYMEEVNSGELKNSPVHTSEAFWRSSIDKLCEENYKVLRILMALLSSFDPETIKIAAHDFGEFVRFHPMGKKILDQLGAKDQLIRLMTHDNDGVREAALLAVQKVMIKNWDIMRGSKA